MLRFPKAYSPQEVLERIEYKQCDKDLMTSKQLEESKFRPVDDRKFHRIFDGHRIKMTSSRLRTFSLRGLKCVDCARVGQVFYKEKDPRAQSYHLNLYAVDPDGREVLMTKDHILPKFWGGINHISNYQTMCTECNGAKGHSI